MKFHDKHYSANRMKLVVLGREPLDELEQWVAELFSDVKNKDLPQNRWDDVQPFGPDNLSRQVFAKPVMDTRSLDIYFVYQDEEHMYDSQPSRYISHLIGHEGPGSILAFLKAKGWANELSAGAMPVCPGSAFFTISVRLTEDGLKQYQEVTKVIFQYISLIKEHPPERWIFEEMKNLSEVDFKFKQKSPASRFASTLSSVMQRPLPREWLLSGTSVLRNFEPELITRGLQHLRADNFNVEVVSQVYPGDWDSREKWYGTEYKVENIPKEHLEELSQILSSPGDNKLPDLHLPHKNEFVPTRLDVERKEVTEPLKIPSLVRNDEHVRTWFKKDDTFWAPKAVVELTLRSPLVYATPATNVMSSFYCELVRDALNEYSYDAELAGLDYSLGPSVLGLEVSVAGYNDKMAVLLEKVLVSMRDLVVRPDRFDIIKERMVRSFRNSQYQQPYYQVSTFTRYLTAEKSWINQQLAAELEHITAEDIAIFFPQLLRHTHIEALVHGNYYKEDALKITNLVESILKPRALPPSQWRVRRNLIIPPGSNYIYEQTLADPANVNHCIEYYLFVGDIRDPQLRAKTLLFAQMTSEPAFDQLRTQEQLGYVVWSGPRYGSTTLGYRVIIQSERDAAYLESRIDSFLSNFAGVLRDMPDEEFEGHKHSVIKKRLEKLKNLGSESGRYWSHIGSEFFDFLQHEVDADTVEGLSRDEMVQFYSQYVEPTSSTRAKLSVHMKAQNSAQVDGAEQKTKLVEELGKALGASDVKADGDKLGQFFDKVDISSGGKEIVISTIEKYLESEAKMSREQIAEFYEARRELLDGLLKNLGITTSGGNANGTPNGTDKTDGVNGVVKENPTKPTYITNVPEFKSGLGVSAATCPAPDLSRFEDTEPKL